MITKPIKDNNNRNKDIPTVMKLLVDILITKIMMENIRSKEINQSNNILSSIINHFKLLKIIIPIKTNNTRSLTTTTTMVISKTITLSKAMEILIKTILLPSLLLAILNKTIANTKIPTNFLRTQAVSFTINSKITGTTKKTMLTISTKIKITDFLIIRIAGSNSSRIKTTNMILVKITEDITTNRILNPWEPTKILLRMPRI